MKKIDFFFGCARYAMLSLSLSESLSFFLRAFLCAGKYTAEEEEEKSRNHHHHQTCDVKLILFLRAYLLLRGKHHGLDSTRHSRLFLMG